MLHWNTPTVTTNNFSYLSLINFDWLILYKIVKFDQVRPPRCYMYGNKKYFLGKNHNYKPAAANFTNDLWFYGVLCRLHLDFLHNICQTERSYKIPFREFFHFFFLQARCLKSMSSSVENTKSSTDKSPDMLDMDSAIGTYDMLSQNIYFENMFSKRLYSKKIHQLLRITSIMTFTIR